MEVTINEKAMQAINSFLERRNFTILEKDWAHGKDAIDFIAVDDENDDLVFIATRIRTEGVDLPEEDFSRKKLERIAAAYLAANQSLPEGTVRFDIVSMLVLGSHKALIRHHRSALSNSSTTEV
jgi:putative endonuclease